MGKVDRKIFDPELFIDEQLAPEAKNSNIEAIFIADCSSSNTLPEQFYQKFLKISPKIEIITPNKKSVSSNYQLFKVLYSNYHLTENRFNFETTVCAGLPAIQMVENLVLSNHKIIEIQGMFSGTLNYVLSTFMNSDDTNDGNLKMSDVVHNAWKQGLTEPNPIDDLSGTDVARKILILSRICGNKMELGDIELKGLVDFQAETADIYFEKMKELDDYFGQLKSEVKVGDLKEKNMKHEIRNKKTEKYTF